MTDVFASEHGAGGVVDDATSFFQKITSAEAVEAAGARGHQLSEDAQKKLRDTAKAASEAFKCNDYLPGFVCEARAPGLGDIPWWVWALLGTGVVGFGALSYVSYKAAPYVLPIAIPESAPFALAWQQARTSEDKQKVAQDALAAIVDARRSKDLGLSKDQIVKDTLAALGARQDQAGRELRSMIPVRG